MNSVQEIERAIAGLTPSEMAELYAWIESRRPAQPGQSATTVFEQGLGLFGGPDDAALLDQVVQLAYEERRRPARPATSL